MTPSPRPVHPWPHSCCVLSHTISDIHMTLKLTVTTHRLLIPPFSSLLCAHPCTAQFREGPGSTDFPESISQDHKITKEQLRFEGTGLQPVLVMQCTTDDWPPTRPSASDHHSLVPTIQPVFKPSHCLLVQSMFTSFSMRILRETVLKTLLKPRQIISTHLPSHSLHWRRLSDYQIGRTFPFTLCALGLCVWVGVWHSEGCDLLPLYKCFQKDLTSSNPGMI